MKKQLGILFIMSALLSAGCYYDKEEELYGVTTNCDTGTVTFSGTVNNLLQQYGCLGCHGGTPPSGNISLAGHTSVKNVATSGKLYGAISHSPGFSAMPQGLPKMNACDIAKIKSWIDAGSPNN
jgi:hypothetical protein